jgi:hypothetical protein
MRRRRCVAEDGGVSQILPESGAILQFEADDRYTFGAFVTTQSDTDTPPPRTWQMPFLGWAVTGEPPIGGVGWGTTIVAVFLHEDTGMALTVKDVQHGLDGRLVRLIPREPGTLR